MSTPTRMKPKIRTLWTDNLLSGDYEQCSGQLRRVKDDKSRYCCLGVLHDLAVKAGATAWVQPETRRDLDTSGFPPPETVGWAGLTEDNPVIHTVGNRVINATMANDDLHWDFPQIARAVLGQVPTLTKRQLGILEEVDNYTTDAHGLADLFDAPASSIKRTCAILVRKGLLTVNDNGMYRITQDGQVAAGLEVFRP